MTTPAKLLKLCLKPEMDAVRVFLDTPDFEDVHELEDLDSKYREDTIYNFQKLLRKENKKTILSNIKKTKLKFLEEYVDNIFIDLAEAEVLSDDLFHLDHINLEWSLQLLDEAEVIEKKLKKARKNLSLVKGVYHSVERGKIDNIEEDIMKKIGKTKKKKKKRRKRKQKQEQTKILK